MRRLRHCGLTPSVADYKLLLELRTQSFLPRFENLQQRTSAQR